LLISLFLTYLVVASLIAFFTVKIVGIPIGKKMFTKIVLSIAAFVPLYFLLAYFLSKFLSRDIKRLEEGVRKLPYNGEVGGSWIEEIDGLSKALSRQAERIKEIIEVQRLTLYRIAHDLRTPLTNVRNVVLALKEGLIAPHEREAYLDKVIAETERIEALLEEALSGLKKVSRKPERKKVEICSQLREIVSLWEVRLRSEGVELLFECDGGALVNLSPLDLEEIVNNLLENSLRHSDSKQIKLSVIKEGDRVLVELSDSGKGMDTSKLQEAYRRGSLGLYIVRELVWRNGGSVEISSSTDGTRVVLSFPSE